MQGHYIRALYMSNYLQNQALHNSQAPWKFYTHYKLGVCALNDMRLADPIYTCLEYHDYIQSRYITCCSIQWLLPHIVVFKKASEMNVK